ncbi:sulfur carrier protein ThiS [Arenimonas sp.]|jgi:sulfur carrier protein|uniref:sulfur carrier protein ThiS n=1 Tax=Arenimonas sp. TaxID=1872635 RepID=UPI0037C0D6AF
MELYLNGELRHFDSGLDIQQLIEQLALSGQRVAVEVNRQIIPKSRHASYQLQDRDRVEIIQAMGGG